VPRWLVVFYAIVEAAFFFAVGLGVPLLLSLVGWFSIGDLSAGVGAVFFVAAAFWAIGHGVPLHITVDKNFQLFDSVVENFDITVVPLAILLVTIFTARRIGRRLSGSADAPLVVAAFFLLVAGSAWLVFAGMQSSFVSFDIPTAVLRVLFPVAIGIVVGWKPWEQYPRLKPRFFVNDIGGLVEVSARTSLGIGAGLLAVASFFALLGVITGFSREISFYEALHTEVFGGLILTFAQIAFIPNIIVWLISWIAGSGFSLGVDSSITLTHQTIGAIPVIPIFGALPESMAFGWWVMLIPVAIAATVGGKLYADFTLFNAGRIGRLSPLARAVIFPLLTAFIVAAVAYLIGSYANGSMGPGQLSVVGVRPFEFSMWLGAEVLVGATIGVSARFFTDSNR
jgi:hypothetical protein